MNKRTSRRGPGPARRYAHFLPVPFADIRPFKSDFELPYPHEILLGSSRAPSPAVVKRVTCALRLAGIAKNAVASLPTTAEALAAKIEDQARVGEKTPILPKRMCISQSLPGG
jgi:hypothetical protein